MSIEMGGFAQMDIRNDEALPGRPPQGPVGKKKQTLSTELNLQEFTEQLLLAAHGVVRPN
jgi:hypothetical protein